MLKTTTMYMKPFSQLLVSTLFVLIALAAVAQTSLVNNQGASIYIRPGALVLVNDDSVSNYAGLIATGGTLRVDGSIYNYDTLSGIPLINRGVYDIGGDWHNNGLFFSYGDSVLLNGDATGSAGNTGLQRIGGTSTTRFHTLVLAGVPGSIKLQEQHAEITGVLDLRSHELATNDYTMYVLNPSTAAILKSTGATGYVSSLGEGKLIRATNTTLPYLFPVGTPYTVVSQGNPFYYRPVEITPTTTSSNEFGVRLVNDPTEDGYEVGQHEALLSKVNPLFYHRITHNIGVEPANVKLFFTSSDGMWTDIAHHRYGEWKYTTETTTGIGLGFKTLSIANWTDFTTYPFALSTVTKTLEPDLLIPTAFSPNNDGVNDIFRPLNKELTSITLQIFNRWGEKVYETESVTEGWDGIYQGVEQELGVYIWQLTYQFANSDTKHSRSGNVTLVR